MSQYCASSLRIDHCVRPPLPFIPARERKRAYMYGFADRHADNDLRMIVQAERMRVVGMADEARHADATQPPTPDYPQRFSPRWQIKSPRIVRYDQGQNSQASSKMIVRFIPCGRDSRSAPYGSGRWGAAPDMTRANPGQARTSFTAGGGASRDLDGL